jgi:hypothetical protein
MTPLVPQSEISGIEHGQRERNACFGIVIFPKNLGRLALFPNIFSVGDFST